MWVLTVGQSSRLAWCVCVCTHMCKYSSEMGPLIYPPGASVGETWGLGYQGFQTLRVPRTALPSRGPVSGPGPFSHRPEHSTSLTS